MNVIDLSDWNDHVNWSHLRDNGVHGMIAKISEGRTLTELFAKHIAGAAGRGMPWGVYAFTHAQTTERAEQEAQNVIEALNALKEHGYGDPALRIWFDLEAPEVIGQDREDVTAICSSFISTCNAAGYSAGIYASYYALCHNVDVYSLADYVPYWCAQYAEKCDFKDTFPDKWLAGWQQTDSFNIDGVNYDMSWFYEE